jgi:hypothetical protein
MRSLSSKKENGFKRFAKQAVGHPASWFNLVGAITTVGAREGETEGVGEPGRMGGSKGGRQALHQEPRAVCY